LREALRREATPLVLHPDNADIDDWLDAAYTNGPKSISELTETAPRGPMIVNRYPKVDQSLVS
jgi:hypothetical protein